MIRKTFNNGRTKDMAKKDMAKKDMAKDERGQTMVEYVLLIAIVVVVSFSVFKKIDGYLVSNPNSFQNKYLRGFSRFLGGSGDLEVRANYKRFTIPK